MQQLIRQPLFVDLTLTTLLTSLLWITACNPKTDDSLREISRIIRAKNDCSTYELVAITIHDTLITADLLKDLNRQVNNWKLEHEQINNQFYKEALFFFGADHVKHLHQDKLKVLDYLDSMELIQAYLMNFSNQDEFDTEYLKTYYTLHHTLESVRNEQLDYLWLTLTHQYKSNRESIEIKDEKLYFFMQDSSTLVFQPSLDDVMIYNIHQFEASKNN